MGNRTTTVPRPSHRIHVRTLSHSTQRILRRTPRAFLTLTRNLLNLTTLNSILMNTKRSTQPTNLITRHSPTTISRPSPTPITILRPHLTSRLQRFTNRITPRRILNSTHIIKVRRPLPNNSHSQFRHIQFMTRRPHNLNISTSPTNHRVPFPNTNTNTLSSINRPLPLTLRRPLNHSPPLSINRRLNRSTRRNSIIIKRITPHTRHVRPSRTNEVKVTQRQRRSRTTSTLTFRRLTRSQHHVTQRINSSSHLTTSIPIQPAQRRQRQRHTRIPSLKHSTFHTPFIHISTSLTNRIMYRRMNTINTSRNTRLHRHTLNHNISNIQQSISRINHRTRRSPHRQQLTQRSHLNFRRPHSINHRTRCHQTPNNKVTRQRLHNLRPTVHTVHVSRMFLISHPQPTQFRRHRITHTMTNSHIQ